MNNLTIILLAICAILIPFQSLKLIPLLKEKKKPEKEKDDLIKKQEDK